MPRLKNMLLLLVFCLQSGYVLLAQTEGRPRFPKAVLVQINTEHNRITYLQKHGKAKDLTQLQLDAVGVAKSMRADFADNFSIYPVYFFDDTNLALVRTGRLQGVLTDINGKVADKNVLSATDSDFFIVYYGFPVVSQGHTKHIKVDSDESFDTRMGRCLVVNNSKMEQLTYVHGQRPLFLHKSKDHNDPERKYSYRSPRFNIDYPPLARKLADAITGLPVNLD